MDYWDQVHIIRRPNLDYWDQVHIIRRPNFDYWEVSKSRKIAKMIVFRQIYCDFGKRMMNFEYLRGQESNAHSQITQKWDKKIKNDIKLPIDRPKRPICYRPY